MKQDEKELGDPFYEKLLGRIYVKRGSAHALVGEYTDSVAQFNIALDKYAKVFSEEETTLIKKDIEKVECRKQS